MSKKSAIAMLLYHPILNEPDPAQPIMDRLKDVKQRACFGMSEFVEMCHWKSPRARNHYESNSSTAIRRVSRAVFSTASEERRVELLTSLRGVGLPMASAILTLTDPQKYGVIDIRVWQILYDCGAVGVNRSGRGFTVSNWIKYIEELRYWAEAMGVRARDVERALFEQHREKQQGRLYKRVE
jgi:hypothetical protein